MSVFWVLFDRKRATSPGVLGYPTNNVLLDLDRRHRHRRPDHIPDCVLCLIIRERVNLGLLKQKPVACWSFSRLLEGGLGGWVKQSRGLYFPTQLSSRAKAEQWWPCLPSLGDRCLAGLGLGSQFIHSFNYHIQFVNQSVNWIALDCKLLSTRHTPTS